MSKTYSRASSLFFDTPLALLPSKADEIRAFWETKLGGRTLDFQDRAEPFEVRFLTLDGDPFSEETGDAAQPRQQGKVAILPLHGVISPRMNMMTAMSGGTSTDIVGSELRKQLNDPNVKAIVFDIDSPGGSAAGVTELASMIMDARGTKPLVGIVNYTGASAAYWIGSALDYLYASPSAMVGGVGVYAMHKDSSKALENEGFNVTLVSAGKNKTRGNQYEPLSGDDVAFIQSLVDDTYSMFIRDVARGRRVSQAIVRNTYGQGDILTAKQALEVGMIDGIKTAEEVILSATGSRPRRPRSASDSAAEGPTFTEHAEQVLADLQVFMERAKSLADLRAEDGRQLNEERRTQIHALITEARAAIEQVEQTVPDPRIEEQKQAAEEAARAEARLAFQRLRLEALKEAAALGVALEV